MRENVLRILAIPGVTIHNNTRSGLPRVGLGGVSAGAVVLHLLPYPFLWRRSSSLLESDGEAR